MMERLHNMEATNFQPNIHNFSGNVHAIQSDREEIKDERDFASRDKSQKS